MLPKSLACALPLMAISGIKGAASHRVRKEDKISLTLALSRRERGWFTIALCASLR
jgi:hypothetical protein